MQFHLLVDHQQVELLSDAIVNRYLHPLKDQHHLRIDVLVSLIHHDIVEPLVIVWIVEELLLLGVPHQEVLVRDAIVLKVLDAV